MLLLWLSHWRRWKDRREGEEGENGIWSFFFFAWRPHWCWLYTVEDWRSHSGRSALKFSSLEVKPQHKLAKYAWQCFCAADEQIYEAGRTIHPSLHPVRLQKQGAHFYKRTVTVYEAQSIHTARKQKAASIGNTKSRGLFSLFHHATLFSFFCCFFFFKPPSPLPQPLADDST